MAELPTSLEQIQVQPAGRFPGVRVDPLLPSNQEAMTQGPGGCGGMWEGAGHPSGQVCDHSEGGMEGDHLAGLELQGH